MEGCRCKDCNRTAGRNKTIFFKHNQILFSVYKDGLTCSFHAKKHITDLLSKYPELLFLRNEILRVDWNLFVNSLSEKHDLHKREMTEILLAAGIFSLEGENNWIIIENRMIISPSGPARFGHVFFTRKEDLLTFSRLNYKNSAYPWYICRISNIISKGKALEDA